MGTLIRTGGAGGRLLLGLVVRWRVINSLKLAAIFLGVVLGGGCVYGDDGEVKIGGVVDGVVEPLMKEYGIPGMAVGVTVDGKQYLYNYGVASKETREAVTGHTLFEVGSFSKTFAATLASYARVENKLSFSDDVAGYLPELKGTAFDEVSLLELGTHTSGLQLFVPDEVQTKGQLMAYLKLWKPVHESGTHGIYSNVGLGLLGMIAAKRFGELPGELWWRS